MACGDLPISIDFLKEVYLFGVRLTNDAGEPFPDSMFEHYIRAARDWLQRHLDILLSVQVITNEKHDYWLKDYRRWAWMEVYRKPIRTISEIRFEYPISQSNFVFPTEWITYNVDKETAASRVQIIPKSGALSEILITKGGNLLPLLEGLNDYVPDALVIDYEAGLDRDELPDDLKHLIGMQAAIGPLNIAGDLLVGAGIASKSVSIPGLSQSINTTSSSTNSGYGSRILEYQKEIKDLLPQVKAQYGRSSQLTVI
jgi:hypothetical protein